MSVNILNRNLNVCTSTRPTFYDKPERKHDDRSLAPSIALSGLNSLVEPEAAAEVVGNLRGSVDIKET